MATFVYKAIDAQGRQVTDRLVAADRAAAIDQLFSRKLNPVSIERQEDRPSHGTIGRRGRVSRTEVESFTRQLANLLAAGIPLSRALNILSHEASTPAAARLWATVHDQVAGGMSLADALGQIGAAGNVDGVLAGDRDDRDRVQRDDGVRRQRRRRPAPHPAHQGAPADHGGQSMDQEPVLGGQRRRGCLGHREGVGGQEP